MNIFSVILAAGEGKRMKSDIAKPLHKICGKSLLGWVLDAANEAGSKKNIVVVGHRGDDVIAEFDGKAKFAWQRDQLGTGHALMQGIEPIKNESGTVMVLYGDTPLISAQTLKDALRAHTEGGFAATVITAVADDPFGYGRIVRENGEIAKIVEQKDCTEEQRKICEINSGMYFFDIQKLILALGQLKNDNAQKEYYATDTIEILLAGGEKVGSYTADFRETLGVNDRLQLAAVGKIKNEQLVRELMLGGVTVTDPQTLYIGAEVKVGRDTVIYPNTILEGNTEIGENCIIGPGATLRNSTVGNNTKVENSVVDNGKIGDGTNVGPFAYIRPNSVIGDNIKIGDFVEVKNSVVGDGTKVSHLTYIGDADVGKNVNFGCGTVIVNYDGKQKHRTTIGNNVFIGCNTNLVSPVTLSDGAYTAAGSTITGDVPENSLAIARARQTVKEGWAKDKY